MMRRRMFFHLCLSLSIGLLLTGCTLTGIPAHLPGGLALLLLLFFSAACRDFVAREEPLLTYLRFFDSVPAGRPGECSILQDFVNRDLSTELSSTGDGFKITGIAGSYSGYDVRRTGDVNGDGINDIISSGYGFDNLGRGAFTGAGYVIFGAAGQSADVAMSTLATTDGFRMDGAGANYTAGEQMTVGDVTGDGIDDVLIVAKGADHLTRGANTGAAYLIFGKTGGFSHIDLGAIAGGDGLRIDGAVSGGRLTSVGTVDLNGDGIQDIVLGAILASPMSRANAGIVYVLYGKNNFSGNIDLAALSASEGFLISGEAANNQIGSRVTTAGDMNGDGVEDLLLGAQSLSPAGKAWVIYGQAGGRGDLDLAALTTADGVAFTGANSGDFTGLHLAGGGDFNGDGLDDIVIDARGSDVGGTDSGVIYLIPGKSSGLSDLALTSFSNSDGYRLIGKNGYGIGAGISFKDLNNDGLADLAFGATDAAAKGAKTGAVSVLFGRSGSGGMDLDLNSYSISKGFTVTGAQAGDGLGYSTAISDVNGDQCPDLIMGGAALNGDTIGRTYVLFGGLER